MATPIVARRDSACMSSPKMKHTPPDCNEALAALATNGVEYLDQEHYPPTSTAHQGFLGTQPRSDFHWEYTEEPHATRRKIILNKHPEIARLFGPCPRTKYTALLSVVIQLSLAMYFGSPQRYASTGAMFSSPLFWAVVYCIGATVNHSLFLAIHEITHGLAFKSYKVNKAFSFIANLPIGLPYSIAFQGYHKEHHTKQGVDGIDIDLPTELEGKLFSTMPGKIFFCFFQILFYALRPVLVRKQTFTRWHLANFITQFSGMFALAYFATNGTFATFNAILYLLTSSFLSGSFHPMAGHFIAEHYVFVKGYETFSYYGMWNILAYNVGYHNEHHDFPSIPGSRLPELRKIASEFYDHLPQVDSWIGTIYNFITLPHISTWSRVKRLGKKTEKKHE